MALTAKENGGAQMEPIEPGVHIAVAYAVIDLGTHHSDTFNKDERKALVIWETPSCRGEFERDGQKVNLPRAISKRYTVSLNDKASLRRDLESWRGRKFSPEELKGFDLKNILGAPCQLQVVHETGKTDGRTFASVAAIMALPKGTPRPRPENPLVFFSFEEAGAKPELPAGLPEWAQKIVMESKEWRAAHTADPAATQAAPATPQQDGDEAPLF